MGAADENSPGLTDASAMGQKSQRLAFSGRLTTDADLQLLVQVFQVGFDGSRGNAPLSRDHLPLPSFWGRDAGLIPFSPFLEDVVVTQRA